MLVGGESIYICVVFHKALCHYSYTQTGGNMDNSLQIKEKLDDIAQYIPGKSTRVAALLGVHVNTLRNMRADDYNISVSTMDKVNELHKKAMKIKKIAGVDHE